VVAPVLVRLATGEHEAGRKFVVDCEQIGCWVTQDSTAEICDFLLRLGNDLRMQLPEETVGFDITVIAAGREPDGESNTVCARSR
jgi:hypothetical protein